MSSHRITSKLLMTIFVLAGCVTPTLTPTVTLAPPNTNIPSITTTPDVTPTPIVTPTLIPTPKPLLSLRVMSYNILLGAGVDRQRDKQLRPQYQNSNRFTDLIVLVKDANPDVLGLQEATDWDRGSPSVIQQVADELKMNYFLAKNPNQMNIAILSKFQIVDAENLSADIGDNGALRATLNTPDGEHLNVFVVHLRTYL